MLIEPVAHLGCDFRGFQHDTDLGVFVIHVAHQQTHPHPPVGRLEQLICK